MSDRVEIIKQGFKSKYSPEETYITAAQYITEIICEKYAQYKGRGLPYKFWQLPEWEKFYKQQIPAANKLLDDYSAVDIVAALRDKRMDKTYSLRNPMLKKIIHEKQKQRIIKPVVHVEHEEKEPTKAAKPFGTKSILNKLKDV